MVVGAVRELNRSQEIGGRPLACAAPGIWPHGTSLMNYLRMVRRPQNPGGNPEKIWGGFREKKPPRVEL